jgi:hypothetical protein
MKLSLSREIECDRNACLILGDNVIMQSESHWIQLFNWYNYWTGMLKNYIHISVLILLKVV